MGQTISEARIRRREIVSSTATGKSSKLGDWRAFSWGVIELVSLITDGDSRDPMEIINNDGK